jgi:phosphoglycerate kinase
MMLRTLDDLDVSGRRVLLRADLNVPLATEDGQVRVADDTRIRAALPTIEALRSRGAAIVLVSHLGRPDGRDPRLSMRPVAERIEHLLGTPVALAPAVVGPQVEARAATLEPGEILMLENVRFEAGETANDAELARALAALADVYVDDAFATAHRAHASTEGVAHLLPAAAGMLMHGEVSALQTLLEHPARPLVAVLGGAKVADKLPLIERFVQIADRVLLGGAMAFPFLAAEGHSTGRCAFTNADVNAARRALQSSGQDRLGLPVDLVVAGERSGAVVSVISATPDVPAGQLGLDIGPATIACFAKLIADAGTVFWNGPVGAFEYAQFATGTRRIAQAIAKSSALTIVCGGETVQALDQLGLADAIDHLSTGGGATLRFLQGLPLPALAALENARPQPTARAARVASQSGA